MGFTIKTIILSDNKRINKLVLLTKVSEVVQSFSLYPIKYRFLSASWHFLVQKTISDRKEKTDKLYRQHILHNLTSA